MNGSQQVPRLPGYQLQSDQHFTHLHQLGTAASLHSASGPVSADECPHQHRPQNTDEDEQWLKWIHRRSVGMAKGADIDLSTFKKILEINNVFFAERLFSIFDVKRKGYFTLDELLPQLSTVTRGCACQKLKLIFDVYDVDGSGSIDKMEFHAVLSSAIDDNALAIGPRQIEYMTQSLFESADSNQDGVLSFDELKVMLEKSPQWFGNLQISFLRPPETKDTAKIRTRKRSKFYFLTPNYIRNHPYEFVWSSVYALSIIGFFLYGSLDAAFFEHRISITRCLPYYAVAHGFGMNLNWNCMLLVVFMLRRTLTLIRNTRIGQYIPVDLATYAHKVVGCVVGVCTLGHVILHLFHFDCMVESVDGFSYFDYLFTVKPGIGWFPPGITPVTGWPILIAYVVIFCCSLAIVRRSGLFEIFYFTHLLYIPFMILLILHSDKFWKFIVVPGTLFILEKLSMTRCIRHAVSGEFYVREAVLWESGVTQITMNRPAGFNFSPSDYVFVNIPSIARFEWHPFTVSSCPENREVVTLHIRGLGQWTKSLHRYFRSIERRSQEIYVNGHSAITAGGQTGGMVLGPTRSKPSVIRLRRASARGQTVRTLRVPVYIDGPYGTSSRDVFRSEHAVLICAGIGVTPFASILQSIMYRHRPFENLRPEDSQERSAQLAMGQCAQLKKVNFIWVVPNQHSIEWFVELLEQLDAELSAEKTLDKLIDIQIYVTSATKMADLYAFALNTALDVFYNKHSRDMITGIRSRAIPGRPNWKTVFENIDRTKRGRVSVFYCGPRVLATDLRRHCREFKFEFKKESF